MCHVLVKIKVDSYAKWKYAYDKRSTMRKESGFKNALIFRNFEDPNEVVILFDWDNLPNARKYMESDNLRKYLKDADAKIVDISYLSKHETSI